MIDLGAAIQKARQEMNLSLSDLTKLLGGTPTESYLSRIERGVQPLSPEAARKLSRVMRVPESVVLNAAGHMTEAQIESAVLQFTKLVVGPAERAYLLPVLDADGQTIETRRRMMGADEQAFLIDLVAVPDEPFVGEALVLTARKPVDGIGVIAEIDGKLSAWTYRHQASNIWIENGRQERRTKGYTIRGVIARVATERTFIES